MLPTRRERKERENRAQTDGRRDSLSVIYDIQNSKLNVPSSAARYTDNIVLDIDKT